MVKRFVSATFLFHRPSYIGWSGVFFLALVGAACTVSTEAVEQDSTSIRLQSQTVALVERRIALSGEMEELINSIDQLIFRIADRKAKGREDEYDILNDALYRLSLRREKIREGKLKVDTTALKDWDDQFVARLHTTMREVNVDIEKIRASTGMAE